MGEKKKKKKTAKESLNPKQREFCELYATNREFFGNGVQSYAEAYKIDLKKPGQYNYARAAASRLLTNDNILSYINELLDVVLNEVHVDKQLAFLITQNADFGSKLGAIKEFNALKERIKSKTAAGVGGHLTLILQDEQPEDEKPKQEDIKLTLGDGKTVLEDE